jgi:hypothetical protein
MPQFEWIDLPVWTEIKVAASEPEEADLARLWQEVEDAIVNLGCLGRLQVAGEAISQITDLFELRSQLTFESIQAVGSDDGPVMSGDAFDRYVRQTMQIDFDVYIEPLSSLPRKMSEFQVSEDIEEMQSVVAEIDRKVLLEAILPDPVDPETAYKEAIGLAHDENVSEWGAAIAQYLEANGGSATLIDLSNNITLDLVKVWLGLLLGGLDISIEQTSDDFYSQEGILIV